MTAPSMHSLGQLRYIDLLSLAIEVSAPSDEMRRFLGSQSKDGLIDRLTRTGPLARLADRAETRLEP